MDVLVLSQSDPNVRHYMVDIAEGDYVTLVRAIEYDRRRSAEKVWAEVEGKVLQAIAIMCGVETDALNVVRDPVPRRK